MSLLLTTPCCCEQPTDDCEHCLQMVYGDTIETICCHSKLETCILQVKRPARTVISCIAPTPVGICPPCTGTITRTLTYAARPDIIVAYKNGACDWLVQKDVQVPDVFNLCNPPEGYDFACDSAPSRFGSAPLFFANRWSVWRNTICAASEQLRWWADIQCYNGGNPIPISDYGFAPTFFTFISGCVRGVNDGTSWRLADYFLGTVHRRIRWVRDCYTDSFEETGALSVQCMTPSAVSFVAAGCPLFEMDLYAAADVGKWGRNALPLDLVERVICAFVTPGDEPTQADLDLVFAHPSFMMATRDWRPLQDTENAFLATLYPAEYGPCGPQTDTVGVSIHKCWPAIRPELTVAAVAALQADCLPASTGAMESNPQWQIRRNAYFRPRPGVWQVECDPASCTAGPWTGRCLRYDGAPFGTPVCSLSGGDCPTCDYCDPDLVDPCCLFISPGICNPGSNECYYLLGAASCDGVLLVYGETIYKGCATYVTCIGGFEGCEGAGCQGYYLYDTYKNYGFIYTINKPCVATDGTPIPFQCIAQDPPANVAQLWPMIQGQQMLARNPARNIMFATNGGSCPGLVQCPECSTFDCDPSGPPVTPVPGSQVNDAGMCGTYILEGSPETYNPCLAICWTADPCTGPCVWLDTVPGCVTAPANPCA